MKINIFIISMVAALVLPIAAGAQVTVGLPGSGTGGGSVQATSDDPNYRSTTDGGLGSDNPEQTNFQIVPCKDDCDFNMLVVGFNRVIKFLLYLSIPLVMGMILWMGFKFMTANGDPGKLSDAKKMFIPVGLGIFWVLAAYIVVYTFLDKLLDDRIGDQNKEDIIFLDVKQ